MNLVWRLIYAWLSIPTRLHGIVVRKKGQQGMPTDPLIFFADTFRAFIIAHATTVSCVKTGIEIFKSFCCPAQSQTIPCYKTGCQRQVEYAFVSASGYEAFCPSKRSDRLG